MRGPSKAFHFARVRAALRAAALRAEAGLRFAARWAWRASAVCDAAACGSFFSALSVLRERAGDGACGCFARSVSRAACLRTAFEVVRGFGAFSFTPARRAFDKPMAIACFADRAPCLPSRM